MADELAESHLWDGAVVAVLGDVLADPLARLGAARGREGQGEPVGRLLTGEQAEGAIVGRKRPMGVDVGRPVEGEQLQHPLDARGIWVVDELLEVDADRSSVANDPRRASVWSVP